MKVPIRNLSSVVLSTIYLPRRQIFFRIFSHTNLPYLIIRYPCLIISYFILLYYTLSTVPHFLTLQMFLIFSHLKRAAVLASVVSSRMLKAIALAEGVEYYDALTGNKYWDD